MMAESIDAPDPQGSSKPIPRNVNSQRSRRNIQQTFDFILLFFIVNFEEITSRQINPYNLIKAVRDYTGEQSVSVTNTGKNFFHS